MHADLLPYLSLLDQLNWIDDQLEWLMAAGHTHEKDNSLLGEHIRSGAHMCQCRVCGGCGMWGWHGVTNHCELTIRRGGSHTIALLGANSRAHRWSPQAPASLLIPQLGPFRPKTAGLHTVAGPNLNNRPSGDSRVDKGQSKDRGLWGSSQCIVADRRGRESYLGT